ncbi:hypothetical protein [Ottowia sp.]|uniref:hypothetical protein n=1 Tax=Ottowia sp. TaxID=1898956 RepID=UPI002CDB527E|nr:hypothetical protein [Ottowia sp.]HOB66033.1 hypothetical protein [Ottowia sp.]HPZ56067.1 hypothetical protein [Ottowia sp.]HQD48616.1 hypothetical protein [Ottowia sp.]
MRLLGLIGLLAAVVIVGLLAKTSLRGTRAEQPSAAAIVPGIAPATPASSVRAQAQQIQQQVQQALDAAMQQSARSVPDDAR